MEDSRLYEFRVLTDANRDDLIAYEQATWSAYAGRYPETVLDELFEVPAPGRFRRRVPYVDQAVFVVYDKAGQIVAGAAANFNPRYFTFERRGFRIPDTGKRIVEGYNVFAKDFGDKDFLSVASSFMDFVIAELIRRQVDVLYGVCSKELRAMYTLMGCDQDQVANGVSDGRQMFLMKYDLA